MRNVTISEAKKRLSEIVERASIGEHTGLAKDGKVVAIIGPPKHKGVDLHEIFKQMERIRKRAKKIPGVTVRSLIEEGRK